LSKIDKGTLAGNPKTLVGATVESGGRNGRHDATTSPVYHALMQALEVLRSQLDVVMLKESHGVRIIAFGGEQLRLATARY
jgi:hypothetical protein